MRTRWFQRVHTPSNTPMQMMNQPRQQLFHQQELHGEIDRDTSCQSTRMVHETNKCLSWRPNLSTSVLEESKVGRRCEIFLRLKEAQGQET